MDELYFTWELEQFRKMLQKNLNMVLQTHANNKNKNMLVEITAKLTVHEMFLKNKNLEKEFEEFRTKKGLKGFI